MTDKAKTLIVTQSLVGGDTRGGKRATVCFFPGFSTLTQTLSDSAEPLGRELEAERLVAGHQGRGLFWVIGQPLIPPFSNCPCPISFCWTQGVPVC
jgi:hypothetical protein